MASNKELELEIHPLDQAHVIGTISIEADNTSNGIQTVILLDQSGSMKDQTRRFTNTIIPLLMSKLSYDKSHEAHLIAFETTSHVYCRTADGFRSLAIKCEGGTYLGPAVVELHKLFITFNANQPIRVLTISDGIISDRQQTETHVNALVQYLKASHFSINSQAVRLFTSSNQPDTKALCSLLQVNNTTTSQLADIAAKESDETIATKIAQLFQSDNFSKSKSLTVQERIIFKFPWDSLATSQFVLLPGGMNVFWMKKIPTSVMIGNRPVKVIIREHVTLTKFQQLMEGKLVYILDHMKILKVLGTDEANKSVNLMLKYFEAKEDELAKKCSNGEKHISVLLAEIAGDENFKNLNPEQMAEYLRAISKKQEEAANRRKKEAEVLRKKQDAEELRKRKEAEELRKKKQEEELRKKQQAEELHKKQEAEKLRKKQEAEQLLKKQEAEELRKRKEAEELRKKQQEEELRKMQEAEEQRVKQVAEELREMREAEEQRVKQVVEELRKYEEAEEIRKKQEAETQHKIAKIIDLIRKSKFHFFFLIIFVLLAIVEYKLQTQSAT